MSGFSEAFPSQETMSIKTFWCFTVATEENISITYFYCIELYMLIVFIIKLHRGFIERPT